MTTRLQALLGHTQETKKLAAMEINPYEPPRNTVPQGGGAVTSDVCTWVRYSWILPLAGCSLAVAAGALFMWRPQLDIMEILAALAAYTGILGGFIFSVAAAIRFLITRRDGKHALAGFAFVCGIPALFAGLTFAYAQWQIDEQERQQREYERSKAATK